MWLLENFNLAHVMFLSNHTDKMYRVCSTYRKTIVHRGKGNRFCWARHWHVMLHFKRFLRRESEEKTRWRKHERSRRGPKLLGEFVEWQVDHVGEEGKWGARDKAEKTCGNPHGEKLVAMVKTPTQSCGPGSIIRGDNITGPRLFWEQREKAEEGGNQKRPLGKHAGNNE